jgi:hypothetical protein
VPLHHSPSPSARPLELDGDLLHVVGAELHHERAPRHGVRVHLDASARRHPLEEGEQHVAAASCRAFVLRGRPRPYGGDGASDTGVRNCGGHDAKVENARAVTRRAASGNEVRKVISSSTTSGLPHAKRGFMTSLRTMYNEF